MIRVIPRPRILTSVLALAVVFAGVSAQAQKKVTVYGEQTTLALSSDFIDALSALGVVKDKVFPARISHNVLTFPISGGAIDFDTAKAEFDHVGGMNFTAQDGTVVVLQNFIIDTTTAKPMISGLVTANGALLGRIPLFDLKLPSLTLPLHTKHGALTLQGVEVTLAPAAAAALNQVFQSNVFVSGFKIGTADVELEFMREWQDD